MKLYNVLVFFLTFVAFNSHAEYFPNIKDYANAKPLVVGLVGGLGIYNFGFYAKDLYKVSKALYKGDDSIAGFKRDELVKHNSSPLNPPLYYLLDREFTESVTQAQRPPRLDQMNLSLSRMNVEHLNNLGKISAIESLEEQLNQTNSYWESNFIPTRNKAINQVKNEYKWRAFKDAAVLVSIGAASYAGYTLINK